MMSSGGDVGVLRKEESARMPAWKRELLERRKAKGEAVSGRANGEVTVKGGPKSEDEATGDESKRAGASPATSPVKTKEPWASSSSPSSPLHPNGRGTETDDDEGDGGAPESLVLRESLGPLQENPFIKLEKERKKRRERETAARPLQHVLELYGSVPGIRTIRAENIIIIESDPDYFTEGLKHDCKLQQNGTVSGYSSLNDLLDRRSSPVTEIRAREVVVYDTALSRSEENLSTLGRPAGDLDELSDGQGRVSRMLQKFDRNYGKLQGKSRSSENLLDLDTGPSRTSHRSKTRPDVVPKYVTSPQPSSPVNELGKAAAPVFQNTQSSKTKSQDLPSASASSTSVSGSPQLVSSFRRRFEASGGRSVTINPREEAERSQAKPVREREWDGTDGASKAKVPCSPESHRSCAELPLSPTVAEPPVSPGFEIHPSPRPDLSALPAGDLQARALANLRLQSRNSFTVVPKRRGAASSPSSLVPSPVPSSPVASPVPHSPVTSPAPSVPTSPSPLPAAVPTEKVAEIPKPAKIEPPQPVPSSPSSDKPSLSVSSYSPSTPVPSSPVKSTLLTVLQEPSADKLPITNIDDVVVEPSPPFPSPVVQRRKGNTFTVTPKRRTVSPEAQEPALTPQGSPSTPQAPYAQLGTLLKKRYPAAEEIEVIGGYLSLGRSCLTKTGSTGKKLKISFNESSLQSTFEYPSESSAWDSGEEEEGGRGGDGGTEEDAGITLERIRIPRPSYTSSPTTHTPNSTDLSSYTPKHSVEFTAWQEHKLDDPAHVGDASSQQTNMSEEVMLTPADSSSLSDYSSEPALYF